MVNLVIFDLDGVLIDSKEFHFEALNRALGKEYELTEDEHINDYDGLPTMDKLKLLSERKGLPVEKFNEIWEKNKPIQLTFLKNQFLRILS